MDGISDGITKRISRSLARQGRVTGQDTLGKIQYSSSHSKESPCLLAMAKKSNVIRVIAKKG